MLLFPVPDSIHSEHIIYTARGSSQCTSGLRKKRGLALDVNRKSANAWRVSHVNQGIASWIGCISIEPRIHSREPFVHQCWPCIFIRAGLALDVYRIFGPNPLEPWSVHRTCIGSLGLILWILVSAPDVYRIFGPSPLVYRTCIGFLGLNRLESFSWRQKYWPLSCLPDVNR
jgi:hypothetical protein